MAPPIHLKWTQKCLTWVSRGFLFGGQLDGMNRLHSRLFARPLTSSKLTSTFLNCPFELNYTTESLGSQSSPSVHPTSRIPEHPRASQSIAEHRRASPMQWRGAAVNPLQLRNGCQKLAFASSWPAGSTRSPPLGRNQPSPPPTHPRPPQGSLPSTG